MRLISNALDLYFQFFKTKLGDGLGRFVGVWLLFVIGIILYALIQADVKERQARHRGEAYEELVTKLIRQYITPNVLNNLIFYNNNISTEIDIVFVTVKGVFCVECKYHKHGNVYAPLKMYTWEIEDTEATFYNAKWQNEGHVSALCSHVHDIPAFNLVINSTDFRFDRGNPDYYTNRKNCADFLNTEHFLMAKIGTGRHSQKNIEDLKKHLDLLPDVISPQEVTSLTQFLTKFIATPEQRKRHKEQQIIRYGA